MKISEFVFLIVGSLCVLMELPEHVCNCSKLLIKFFFMVEIPGKRFPRYVFGYKNAIELFIDCKRLCNVYYRCSFFKILVFVHHAIMGVIIFQPAGRFGKKFCHYTEIFSNELISADGMGRVVLKNVNRTFFIFESMPNNLFNKPVPERIPWV